MTRTHIPGSGYYMTRTHIPSTRSQTQGERGPPLGGGGTLPLALLAPSGRMRVGS